MTYTDNQSLYVIYLYSYTLMLNRMSLVTPVYVKYNSSNNRLDFSLHVTSLLRKYAWPYINILGAEGWYGESDQFRLIWVLVSLLVRNLWCVQILGYTKACVRSHRICLYITLYQYYHYADLPESIELIIYLSGISYLVSKNKSFLSITFYTKYEAVRFQLIHFCCNDRENMCVLSYYSHQIGNRNH